MPHHEDCPASTGFKGARCECIEMRCLYCKEPHRFMLTSPQANGIFNVFCQNGECEDRYAASL